MAHYFEDIPTGASQFSAFKKFSCSVLSSAPLPALLAGLLPFASLLSTLSLTDVLAAARFDFSHYDADYHQETLNNLQAAMKKTKKMCAVSKDDGLSERLCERLSDHIE